MREWRLRIVILALLAVIVGVPLLLRREGPGSTNPGTAPAADAYRIRLIVMTPHGEQIRDEFAAAFNRWRISQGHAPVAFDWRTGGTNDLKNQAVAEFEAKARQGREDQGIEKDLFFGGGDFTFNQLAAGLTVTRDEALVHVAILAPLQVPPALLKQVFPSPTIGGERLYQKDLLWVGVALSSFGIVYNRDCLTTIGLPEPATWSDLADRRYRTWLALADPAHSGSVATTYDTILRRLGWEQGWKVLRRCIANARYVTDSGSRVPVDVSAGEAAAGMCIDYYGRFQSGAVGGGRVGYVDPAGMTAITADPVALLRGAPHAELAQEFALWLLSPEAQGLWQRRIGTPGGPERYELRRLPIRVDMYQPREMQTWTDQVNPFAIARPAPPGMPRFGDLVPALTHAIAIDTKDELVAALQAVEAHPDHPHAAEMAALLDALPPDLQTLWPADWSDDLRRQWGAVVDDNRDPRRDAVIATAPDTVVGVMIRWKLARARHDQDALLTDQARWTSFFRSNYRRIVALSEQR